VRVYDNFFFHGILIDEFRLVPSLYSVPQYRVRQAPCGTDRAGNGRRGGGLLRSKRRPSERDPSPKLFKRIQLAFDNCHSLLATSHFICPKALTGHPFHDVLQPLHCNLQPFDVPLKSFFYDTKQPSILILYRVREEPAGSASPLLPCECIRHCIYARLSSIPSCVVLMARSASSRSSVIHH
jgi:hypothetical protein